MTPYLFIFFGGKLFETFWGYFSSLPSLPYKKNRIINKLIMKMVRMLFFPMEGSPPRVIYVSELDVFRIKEIINTDNLHCWRIVGEDSHTPGMEYHVLFAENCLSTDKCQDKCPGVNLCIPRYCFDLLLAMCVDYICGNVIVCQVQDDKVVDMEIEWYYDEYRPPKGSDFLT